MEETTSGFATNVWGHWRSFLALDPVTIGLVVIFVVTIAVLWARGPLENILRE